MTQPAAVCFDLDGLMFNSEDVYWEVGRELLRRRGREFTRRLSSEMMGRTPQGAFEVMIRREELDDDWRTLAAESETVFISLLEGLLAPMPGLLELLDALQRVKRPMAICTSSSRRLLLAVLERFDLEPRFAFTLSAEDVTHGKPNPEIYQKAAGRFGLVPSEMLVLEDSETGCRAAAASGAFVVAVPGEHSKHQNFSMAALVLESLAEGQLLEVLGLIP